MLQLTINITIALLLLLFLLLLLLLILLYSRRTEEEDRGGPRTVLSTNLVLAFLILGWGPRKFIRCSDYGAF